MLSRKSVFWILPFTVLVGVGLLTGLWQLPVVGISILVFYSICQAFAPPRMSIKTSREVEKNSMNEGDEFRVTLTIENRGGAVPLLEVHDRCPGGLVPIGNGNRRLISLERHETAKLCYSVKAQLRGIYALGPTRVTGRGIFSMEFEDDVKYNENEISVFPRMYDLRKVKVRPKNVRNIPGIIRSRRIGMGTEFTGLRDYIPGDDRKHINWKASARLDKLITNEYETERATDVVIILDAREEATVGGALNNTTETGVRAALTLAYNILRDKNRVGLITISNYLDWVYPGYGRQQFYKIAGKLARLSPGGVWSVDYLKWVAQRFFPRRAHLIIITPLVDEKMAGIIVDICRRDFTITVLSPSPVIAEMAVLPQNTGTAMACSIVGMERRAKLSELERYVNVIDWNTDEPLAAALMGADTWG
jgi:uncharacterized protein (DUF58 family)